MEQAKTKQKTQITAGDQKKVIGKNKLKVRNITNHTIQLHLPNYIYVRIGPSEFYELTEYECRSRILKKLERENIVSIAWSVKPGAQTGKATTKEDTTPFVDKDEEKEKKMKEQPDKNGGKPAVSAETSKEKLKVKQKD